jgi:hypothetical protein
LQIQRTGSKSSRCLFPPRFDATSVRSLRPALVLAIPDSRRRVFRLSGIWNLESGIRNSECLRGCGRRPRWGLYGPLPARPRSGRRWAVA